MTLKAGDDGNLLLETIKNKDVQKSYMLVQQFKEKMKDHSAGADYIAWISEPVNLTKVQKALAEDLNVPPRVMLIKRVSTTKAQKAYLLIQAIEGAIKRVHKL